MNDIVERLRFRADENYEMLGNIHEPLLEAAAEIERLRAGGCARDQGTTQYCAEAAKLAAENERLRAWNREIAVNAKAFAEALREIADFDTDEDISNEECMRDIARAALEGRT
jgi:hypothetical protein